ncbi:MAG TPA: hypothetical protein VGM87_01755 [Roseomonas sp.]
MNIRTWVGPLPGLGLAAGLGVALLVAGCANRAGQGAQDEGCRAQLTSFNEAGEGFVRPARPRWSWRPRPAAPPPVGLDGEVTRENADLDSLQIAFDSLLYCRWIEARTVRADMAAGRVPRPQSEARMTALRARLRADLDRARAVLAELEQRAAAREDALEAVAPGSRQAAARVRSARGAATQVVAAATVPLRLRPDAGAPEVGRVAAGQNVTIRAAENGFAYVEGASQLRGYAAAAAFQVAERALAAQRAAEGRESAATGAIRRLAATNLARRDNFAESVTLAENAAVSGFELGS